MRACTCCACCSLPPQVRGEAVVGHHPLLRPGALAGCALGTAEAHAQSWQGCHKAPLPTPRWPVFPASPHPPCLRTHPASPLPCLPTPSSSAGAADFVYQSCTHQREPAGSMEGSFAFVEGTLQVRRSSSGHHCRQGSDGRGRCYGAALSLLLASWPANQPCHAACRLPALPGRSPVCTPCAWIMQAPRREFDVVCAPFRLDVPDIVF